MDKLFLTILNMSLTGAFVIAAICLARLPLKKAPKIISYCLWVAAWFRLVFPVSIESAISLIPFNSNPIPTDITVQVVQPVSSGILAVESSTGNIFPAATSAANSNLLHFLTDVGLYIWFTGVVVMLAYGVISYFRLKRKMINADCAEDNVFESNNVLSPFILGIIKPRIYIPFNISPQERKYIILHEQTHIYRKDHIIKIAAYIILCFHWFNPLAWIAFILMGADMEMSCDEKVLKELGADTKKDYAHSLLLFASKTRFLSASPLSFSEGELKRRINNALKYKKTPVFIGIIAIIMAVTLSIGLMLNKPVSDNNIFGESENTSPEITLGSSDFVDDENAVVYDDVSDNDDNTEDADTKDLDKIIDYIEENITLSLLENLDALENNPTIIIDSNSATELGSSDFVDEFNVPADGLIRIVENTITQYYSEQREKAPETVHLSINLNETNTSTSTIILNLGTPNIP